MKWFHDERDEFFARRMGLFLHWGIYSIPEWQEQHIYRKKMSRAEYVPLMEQFNPQKYDPEKWLDVAEEARMQYLCFTTKHIDGFCMWDTQETAFKITNTPYGKDALAMLAEACHRRGFPLCLYYSLTDLNQPNYPHSGQPHEFAGSQLGDEPNRRKYLAYVKAQVKELCTQYGKIHGFWWDANHIREGADPSLNAMIRELQPGIVINNRGMDDGDFSTAERDWYDEVNTDVRFEKPLEACQSIGAQSWSYRKDEDYYSDAHLIGSIQKVLAKGGNYLLNIGPKADGTLPVEATTRLARIGRWYASVKESLTDVAGASELTSNRDVILTRRGNTLYVHLFKEPIVDAVNLHPITDVPRRATLLNTGESLQFAVRDLPWLHNATPTECLGVFNLPVNDRRLTGWVLKLEFENLSNIVAEKIEVTG